MNVELRKCYVRFRDGHPDGDAQAYAYQGLRALDVEVVGFDWVDDIDGFDDLGPEVGVAGYVGDLQRALAKIRVPFPAANDYPDALRPFLYRQVCRTTTDQIRDWRKPVFVKPVALKAFGAFVCDVGTRLPGELLQAEQERREIEVWLSDVEFFAAEFRAFILHRKVLDVRRYKGDWALAPNRTTIEEAVKAMGRRAPHAYCLDWGVVRTPIERRFPPGSQHAAEHVDVTKLVEYNHAFCFGHYGLAPQSYARMIAARWHELASQPKRVEDLSLA